jgi:hypothetical protein
LYYLFLDESGDIEDFYEQQDGKGGSSRFLSIGGIIVNEINKTIFENEYKRIISTYFNFSLPPDFKLHYKEIRNTFTQK